MDLALFQFSDTAEMAVRSPVDGLPLKTSDDKPVMITFSGRDSVLYRKMVDDIREDRLGNRDNMTPDERLSDMLARMTVSWSGIVFEGRELPCDFEHAFSLYKKTPWLREQAEPFFNLRRNFTKA